MARFESPRISVFGRGTTRGDADCTVVRVRGEHDIATKLALSVAIARAADRGDVAVLVDLSEVTFMDASTVGAIVESRIRLRSRAQSLELRAPSTAALRILELCGLTGLIHVEPVHSAGAAAALGTWVDIPSMANTGPTDDDAEPGTARPATHRSTETPAAVDSMSTMQS